MNEMNQQENTILIVEDDIELAALIAEYLSARDFAVSLEHDGQTAVQRIINEQPSLVVLDLMLPGKDGISICRECRFEYDGPILFLTASNDAVDQILGLEIGADDFVQKPVEPRILLARIRALLRRTSQKSDPNPTSTGPETLRIDGLTLNLSARTVSLDGNEVDLTTPEFDALEILAKNAGQIVSRDALFQGLRNLDYDGQSRFIDITISHIRKKLSEKADEYLKTVRGKGYMLIVKDSD